MLMPKDRLQPGPGAATGGTEPASARGGAAQRSGLPGGGAVANRPAMARDVPGRTVQPV